MEHYRIDKGVIVSEDGVPYLPRYLADERLSVQINRYGLGDIEYFCPETEGHYRVFLDEFWGGLKFFLRNSRDAYSLHIGSCRIYPFGYEGEWKNPFGEICFRQFLADNCVITEIHTGKSLEKGVRFGFEFYGSYAFTPYSYGDIRYKSGVERTWRDWRFEQNCLSGGFYEEQGEVGICFKTDFSAEFSSTARNVKYRLYSDCLEPDRIYRVVTAFAPDGERAARLCGQTLEQTAALFAAQTERYARVAEKAPVLESGYRRLNDFFALAPYYHESLKIYEHPGAVRAKSCFYWVWGWDGMTANEASVYWGDASFLGDMLGMYQKFTAPGEPVAHAFSRDMRCIDPCPPPAEGMYITLLQLYLSAGGDPSPYYGFAKEIFSRILQSCVGETGLCKGTSLFPDFRALLGEDGNDISSFNNSVCYCALRSMEQIAEYMKDATTAEQAAKTAGLMKKHFMPVLYEPQRGYVACSARADTLKRRPVCISNSLKWENSFLAELTFGHDREFLDFFKRDIVTEAGLREVPSWCSAYDEDANQLHCWWPVTGEYYARLVNRYGESVLAEQWIGWVSYWTERLMCPEGIPCYDNTAQVPFDNWNCKSGTWQAYNLRGFYQAAVHSIVGVEPDGAGITVYPSPAGELRLSGLHFGRMTADIRVRGSGSGVEKLIVNGKVLKGTHRIPADLLAEKNKIEIFRTSEREKACLLGGRGIKMEKYAFAPGRIEAALSGAGNLSLFFRVTGDTHITADGVPIALLPNEDGEAELSLHFSKEPIKLVMEDEALCI